MSELDEFFPRDEPFPEPSPAREKVAPKVYGQRGERWVRDYFFRLAGIKLEKRSDAPYEVGRGFTVYPGQNQLDHQGYGMIPGAPAATHFEVEVKTFEGSYPIGQLTNKQRDKLTEATSAGVIGILALVERKGMDIVRMWPIPWPQQEDGECNTWRVFRPAPAKYYPLWERREITAHNFAWVMARLRERAFGNFKAKSIRPRDQDLLEDFRIEKEGQEWKLSPTHWWRDLFNIREEQPKLL